MSDALDERMSASMNKIDSLIANAEAKLEKDTSKQNRQKLKLDCIDRAIQLTFKDSSLEINENKIIETAKLFYKFVRT